MATTDLSEFENDPRLFLFTSLTAGSSHIITATSRLETILKANKIPFLAIDTATNDVARKLWQRRGTKKKLPGLVKDGFVIGDLEEVEEWNEFGELKENIGPVPAKDAPPTGNVQGVNIRPSEPGAPFAVAGNVNAGQLGVNKAPPVGLYSSKMRPLPGAEEIAARNKPLTASGPLDSEPAVQAATSPPPQEKEGILNAAKEVSKHHPSLDHLSAPASRIQSGTATPQPEVAVEESTKASEEGVGEAAPKRYHRGSEIKEVPNEEIKKVESGSALHEEDDEEESTAKAVEGLQVGEGKDTQKQEAKEPEDAAKSVED